MEYRIEQLAKAAGVAVDTIRFYQGKGLLEPPRRDGRVTWYSDPHLERLRRIRSLQQRGFTLAVIRRFLEGELETSDEALVEAVTTPGAPETLGLDDLAARSGLAAPLLRQLEQAGLLLPVAGCAEPRYPAEDLAVLAAGLKLVEAGVPLGSLMELGARHATAVEQTARDAVDLFDRHVRERIQAEELPPDAAERQLLRTFHELLEASGTLVRHHFQRALLRAARERIERRS
ncbi:MAG TPA: MerR family transcriptional regulator [Candidatus Dormibacteraeota bacterium]|nr:MerR family transcriptional regulator [Candidatus Dormibacteraeota bacterium]